jgi:hypothetical protein
MGGRVVNTWGDAVIAEFASAVEAVRAAVNIQSDIESGNLEKPDGAKMRFRIGLNLGDVIVEGTDIYGDGVNIAARLQAEAPAGGIVISRTVHDQVHGKLKLDFLDLGALDMKNIASGVHGYSVHPPDRLHSRSAPATTRTRPPELKRRSLGIWGGSVLFLVAVNLMTWNGTLWAGWPLMALAACSAHHRLRKTGWIDRGKARLAMAAATILAVNVLTWHGAFWAAWPILVLATVGGRRHLRPAVVTDEKRGNRQTQACARIRSF